MFWSSRDRLKKVAIVTTIALMLTQAHISLAALAATAHGRTLSSASELSSRSRT
jgi:hypothetical protein